MTTRKDRTPYLFRVFLALLLGAVLAAASAATAPAGASPSAASPIPSEGSTSLPTFVGAAATAHTLPAYKPPRNPWMAPNPFNNMHNDPWMSDTYAIPGPLGRSPVAMSSTLRPVHNPSSLLFECGAISFDSRGRLVTVCTAFDGKYLVVIDPKSLEPLASLTLPAAKGVLSAPYFYLDNRDRTVVATATNHIWVVAESGTATSPTLTKVADYDVSATVGADSITALLPDWTGRIWFVTGATATVGVLDPRTQAVHTIRLHSFREKEEISNSFAMTSKGAFIATTRGLYELAAGKKGVPRVVWAAPYENAGTTKPGQFSAGTGTTPTVLAGGKYVAIADNAHQMHVVVYRTRAKLAPNQKRVVCQAAVFDPGKGATENSLIGSGRSLIVENNYGYLLDNQTAKTTKSEPGVARVDVRSEKSCRVVWTNTEVAVPSVVPKLSTRTGLIYLFVKQQDATTGLDVWYWTAVDFRSGKTVWQRMAGTGRYYNNHYSAIAIGPNGTAYLPALTGMMAIKDAH